MSEIMNKVNEGKNNLVYIAIDKLYPHPDNPRKDLGDLTELAESIKIKGVMQNLTVVPGHYMTHEEWQSISKQYDTNPSEELRKKMNRMHTKEKSADGYTVIIGHRRMAAAKLAGLTELPCVIVDLTSQEQVATMLLENMQRSDLTVYEQAKGMQMMLDFGETVETISEKTGFSQTTVRRRVKLMELDQEALKKASGRQLSFHDLDRLNKITDIKVRNKVLADIGTNNFENSYRIAISNQEKAEREKRFKDEAEKRGFLEIPSQADKWSRFNRVEYIYSSKDDELAKLDALDAEVQYYYEISYGSLYVYKEKPEKDTAEIAEQKKLQELRENAKKVLAEASKRAFELRLNFIKTFSKTEAKKRLKEIAVFLVKNRYCADLYANEETFCMAFCVEDEQVDLTTEIDASPEFAVLCAAYAGTGDDDRENYYDYYGKYAQNENLDNIYKFLKTLGYEMSDEEIELQNGTSELFYKEESDDENAETSVVEENQKEDIDDEADEDDIAVDDLVSELLEMHGDGNEE